MIPLIKAIYNSRLHFYTERLVEESSKPQLYFSKNDRPDTESLDCVVDIVKRIVPVLERSSAAYHDIEHTFYVVTCGLDIIKGRFIQNGDVSEKNWRHFASRFSCMTSVTYAIS